MKSIKLDILFSQQDNIAVQFKRLKYSPLPRCILIAQVFTTTEMKFAGNRTFNQENWEYWGQF